MKRIIFAIMFILSSVILTAQNKFTYPLEIGKVGISTGKITLFGIISGTAELRVPSIAGTGTIFEFPSSNGTSGYVLTTNGGGVTSWTAPSSAMVYPGAGIPLSTGSAWGTSITNNSANWNTAYGWGNHSSAGYYVGTASTIRALISSSATGLTYTNGTGVFSLTSGYEIPSTTALSNAGTAYTDRLKWDGGSTGLTAATGRTSLGGTTVGQAFFTLTNPSLVGYLRINADNTVTVLSLADFKTALSLVSGDVELGNVTNESKTTMFTNSGLTGVPTAPTAVAGTNTTQIATTAFVKELGDTKAATNQAMYIGTTSVAINRGSGALALTGITSIDGIANIAGGTAGAIPYQSAANTTGVVAATATANKMLLSGASAIPTWSTSTIPTSAGASVRKALVSDGTNYVLSSATLPTSGDIVNEQEWSDKIDSTLAAATEGISATGNTPLSTGNITANVGVTAGMLNWIMYYNGNSAIDISANPQIVDGSSGQEILIVGSSDTNTLTLEDANGLQLAGGATFVLGIGDTIRLIYITTLDLWVEVSRSNN